MSLPQSFKIVVADTDGSLSPAITVVLGGPVLPGFNPYLVPARSLMTEPLSHAFEDYAQAQGIRTMPSLMLEIIDPRRIDLWIALTSSAEAAARRRIREAGPPPRSFYRIPFPDPVVRFRKKIPPPPKDNADIGGWFDRLTDLLAGWRVQIERAFSDSS